MFKKNYPNCNVCSWSNVQYACTAQGMENCAIVYGNKHCRKLFTSEKLQEYNFKLNPKA
jgi:hypothetical protein